MSKTKTTVSINHSLKNKYSFIPILVCYLLFIPLFSNFSTEAHRESTPNPSGESGISINEEYFTLFNLHLTAFLQGPFNPLSNTMSDALRSGSLLPANDPYTEFPTLVTTSAGAGVFAVADANNAIVDWVLIEIRDATVPTTLLASRSALIQRDGNIVSASDGVSDIQFLSTDLSPASIPSSVHLSIKHRNHLAIITMEPLITQTGTITYNFSTSQTQAAGINPMAPLNAGTLFGLWGGNVNGDTKVRYTNSVVPLIASDAIGIFNALGGGTSNEMLNVYNVYDVNLDSHVRYTNKIVPSIPSDAIIIFNFLAGDFAGQANQGF